MVEEDIDVSGDMVFKGADFSPENYAILRDSADGASGKSSFLPDQVLAHCEPLDADSNATMGGVSIKHAFLATITVPATVLFPVPLALVVKVFDFGDDLTPYCGQEAREQRSQCVILSYAATIRDPQLRPAELRQRLEGNCAQWHELYMPEKGVMSVEAMQTVQFTAKPDLATLRHQFDCVSNLLPLGSPSPCGFLPLCGKGVMMVEGL
jgi:hypothetical protein